MLTLETHLKEQSLINKGNLQIYNLWVQLKDQITDKLKAVANHFPHFSEYGASHSINICAQIERFLGEDRIKKLSASDTWMLLMAFYGHHIGMALRYHDIIDFCYSEEFKSKLHKLTHSNSSDISNAAKRLVEFDKFSSDKNRSVKEAYVKSINVLNDVLLIIKTNFEDKHSFKATIQIDELMQRFQINDSILRFYIQNDINFTLIAVLRKICINYRQDIQKINQLPYLTLGLSDDLSHPRFIAGMLCLGELLDFDTHSANLADSTGVLPIDLGLYKHESTTQFYVSPKGIKIESKVSNLNMFRTVKAWVEALKKTTDYLTKEWDDICPENFGHAPLINVGRVKYQWK